MNNTLIYTVKILLKSIKSFRITNIEFIENYFTPSRQTSPPKFGHKIILNLKTGFYLQKQSG
jgi:hypothetical protein